MSISLSDRSQSIRPSPTLEIAAKTKQLKNAGKNIIGLSVGEPECNTPLHIRAAGINAIHNGITKYTPVGGLIELKSAILHKFSSENNLHFTAEQIIASNGAKQSIMNVMLATLNPGDEVIIPAPYWPSYYDMCLLVGATPVVVSTTDKENFKMSATQLSSAITKKTKLVFLNSPSNPTGIIYSKEELQKLATVFMQHPNIIILSDDIYERIIWPDKDFYNILNVEPKLKDQTVIVNGVSKAYAMTGWRLGYAAAPEYLTAAMEKIQSQTTSGPCSISQIAAQEALESQSDEVDDMIHSYYEKYLYVKDRLYNMKGIQHCESDGTFYVFPNCSELIKQLALKDDFELAEYLLEHANVAVVPGSVFGCVNHIRISIATSKKNLSQAFDNIEYAITEKI